MSNNISPISGNCRKAGFLLAAGTLAVTLMILSGHSTAAPTNNAASPWDLLNDVKTTMVTELNKPALRVDKGRMLELVSTVLLPHVDTRVAAQLVLGKHWKTMAAEQRGEFVGEFTDYLLRFYSQALAGYVRTSEIPDNFMVFEPVRTLDDSKLISIRSTITSPHGKSTDLSYRLRNHNGWRVIDISLAGVSMAQLYRAQFAAIVEREGIDGLIAELRAQNARLAAADPAA